MTAVLEQVRPLEDFLVMSDAEIAEVIEAARRELGNRVVIANDKTMLVTPAD